MNLEGLRSIQEDELRMLIRPSGYMVRKASAIKAFVTFLDRSTVPRWPGSRLSQPGGSPPTAGVAGVGKETADAILLYALLHPVAVVDEYLRRIADRHGLAGREQNIREVQQLVDATFANDPAEFRLQLYNEFHALVVAVGKNHCGPKPRCEGCPLAAFH